MVNRCERCGEEKILVSMYNHKTGSMGRACSGCIGKKFWAIMTLAKIDFARVEEEVNGNV
jgi:hypothetical protein